MASRSFKKYANLGLEEEKDFFLAALNKRIRNGRKKLEQIDELSKKDKSTLKAEQIEKINSKAEVLENIKYVDDIKEIYYSSYKLAKDEGKIVKSAAEVVPYNKTAETQEAPVQVQAQAPVQVQEVDTSAIVHESLSKVLNLVHLAQFFRDQAHTQEFRQTLQSVDLQSLHELYTKIFTFTESDKFVRVEDKLTRSLSELESYVNATEQPALRNQTYEFLQAAVERVAESSSFREHKADVSAHQKTGAEHSAIGSELKKVQEPVEVPQVKTVSPVKESKPVEVTKASPEKEARRDWGAVEDEEEEEVREVQHAKVEQVSEKQQPEEQKKVDDEWATVTVKRKEKKEEKPFRAGNKPFRGGDKPFRGGEQREQGQRRPRPEGEVENRRAPREQGERQEVEGGKPRGTGTRGGYKGGERQGGYQKRETGDTYQKKGETTNAGQETSAQ